MLSHETIAILIEAVKLIVVFALVISAVPILTWVERRGSAFLQNRLGPNRIGLFGITIFGLLQPAADGIKFMFKEETNPANASKWLFILAPGAALGAALMVFAVIPFGPEVTLFGYTFRLQVANLNIGLLYVFAFSGLAVYGVLLAGWSSNNKYSLMGSMRGSAQMISYELAMGLSVLAVILMAGTLDPMEIVEKQGAVWFVIWGGPLGMLAALIFTVCAFAETNRLPFDLPEGESELVAGYHVEYSGMKFSMFFMAEYIHMISASAMIVTLFLGGWNGFLPFGGWFGIDVTQGVAVLLPVAAFIGKMVALLWFFVWVRWTLPRFRYDQLMFLGWKVLLPLSLANLFLVAAAIAIQSRI